MNGMSGVILLSGGMDSVTLLNYIKNEYPDATFHAINLYYGQRHVKEMEYSKYWCDKFNIKYTSYNLEFLKDMVKGVSAMVSDSDIEVPDKEYDPNETPSTYVPFRNAIFSIIAASYCESNNLYNVYYAGHASDAGSNYWDCTEEFVNTINELLLMRNIKLIAPFINYTKADIAKTAKKLNVDLSKTWSCYKGGDIHCGTCSTCRERILAIKKAGIEDKTEYKENPYKDE